MNNNAIDIAAVVVSAVALMVSARACSSVEEFNSDSLYITTVNTRVQTCTALSTFHRDLGSASPQVTDQGKEVTSPSERAAREASLARALTLCLAEYRHISDVRECVNAANKSSSHFVHDVIVPSTPTSPAKGADILACYPGRSERSGRFRQIRLRLGEITSIDWPGCAYVIRASNPGLAALLPGHGFVRLIDLVPCLPS